MLEQLPELERYCTLSITSRHHEPICHHSKPMLTKSTMEKGLPNDKVNPTKQTAETEIDHKTKSKPDNVLPGQNP